MVMRDVINPRQTIVVSCRSHIKSVFSPDMEDKDNLITLSWHMPVSSEPEMYAIALAKKRFSYSLIKESGVFCVNFMPYSLEKEVLFCGRNSGKDIDKFKESGLEKEECKTIDCPRIKQATGCLECELVNEIEVGDHVILFGKVLDVIEKTKEKKIFQVKGDKFSTIK